MHQKGERAITKMRMITMPVNRRGQGTTFQCTTRADLGDLVARSSTQAGRVTNMKMRVVMVMLMLTTMKQEGVTDAVQVSAGSQPGDPGQNLTNNIIVF